MFSLVFLICLCCKTIFAAIRKGLSTTKHIQTAMYLERGLEDSTSQVHHSRQTVKNAGRGFAPETQDEDIVDEVFGRCYC